MKSLRVVAILFFSLIVTFPIQLNAQDDLGREFRRVFVESCIDEFKVYNLDVHYRKFCNCTYDKFIKRFKESGADLDDERAIVAILEQEKYKTEVETCLLENTNSQKEEILSETEERELFYKTCAESLNKNKYVRENTDVQEVCSCVYDTLIMFPITEDMAIQSTVNDYIDECIFIYLESKDEK